MASVPKYGQRWPTYAKQWDQATLKPERKAEIERVARRLVAAKSRYQDIQAKTGVPWWMIACIHERESSQDWSKSLAQGDPWNRISTHVPKGRGPFKSFEEAAIDALKLDGLSSVKDWRLEKVMYYWEKYNGWGYVSHGIPSPYLFGATTVQRPGKYVSDGVWSSTAMDQQLGCVAMLKGMMALDPSIQPIRETASEAKPTPVTATAAATAAIATAGGVVAHTSGMSNWTLAAIIAGIVVLVPLVVMFVRRNMSGGD